MLHRAPSTAVQGWPTRRANLAGILWLIIAVSATALGLSVSALFLGQFQSAAARSFAGALRPSAPAVPVVLPAGLPLKSVQVSEGERVTSGQTLAVLDRPAIQAQSAALNRRLLAARTLRACLLWPGRGIPDDPQTPDSIGPEAQTQVSLSLRECAAEKQRAQSIDAGFEDQLELTARRIQLLADYARRTQPQDRSGKGPVGLPAIRAALGIALSQTELVAERLAIEQTRAAALRQIEADRLQRSRGLTQEIETLLTRRVILDHYAAAPRLTAPQTGRVARIRAPKGGRVNGQSVTLMHVLPGLQSSFEVEARLPANVARTLPLGTPVEVTLFGLGAGGTPLTGKVSRLAPGTLGDGVVAAQITLDDSAQAWLTGPENRLAFGARETASDIRMYLPAEPLRPRLATTLHRHLPKGGDLWLTRIRRAFNPVSPASAGESDTEPSP